MSNTVISEDKQSDILPTHLFWFVQTLPLRSGDCGSTVVKVPCYKSEGRWFDPS